MRELLVRSMSGIIYVSLVVISALYAPEWVFILLFCVFAFICLVELMPMIRLRQWVIYPMLPLAYYFIVWQGVNVNVIYLLLIATLLVNIYLIRDLVLVDRIALFNTKKHIIALLYLIGSSLFLFGFLKNWRIITITKSASITRRKCNHMGIGTLKATPTSIAETIIAMVMDGVPSL